MVVDGLLLGADRVEGDAARGLGGAFVRAGGLVHNKIKCHENDFNNFWEEVRDLTSIY